MIDDRPWFERFPELEAWEFQRFTERGLPAQVDQGRRDDGQLVIATQLTYRDAPLAIEVRYPSEYPELPPVVYGPPKLLDRHQHQIGANFCLLERPLDDWKARDWGAADLVAEQLVGLLADTVAGADVMREREAPMPEPSTSFLSYARDAAVIVPGELAALAQAQGQLRLGRVTPHLYVVENIDSTKSEGALDKVLPAQKHITAKYQRFDQPPLVDDGSGAAVVAWLRAHHPHLLSRRLPRALVRNGKAPAQPTTELLALVFPEEGPGVGETRDAWVFVCIDRSDGNKRPFLFHAQVISPTERARRIPDLPGLPESRVVVLGVGSVGGDVAIELARAGVGHLELVDFDRFEATNTVRHPLGLDFAGLPKNGAVAIACHRANPYCTAVPHDMRLGADDWSVGDAPIERLARLLENADLVIEATGSHQIAQFASRLCADADLPLVAGWMTDGFYGAEVVRIAPGETMCWTCFASGHRGGSLPHAESGPEQTVVVQGCSHPTVAGAGFDVAECAALLTRLSVGTLESDTYPQQPWNYAAISFRRAPDDPQTPRMATDMLVPWEGCHQCQAVGLPGAPTTN